MGQGRPGHVRQFLDIGTGLPTADNTHEVAQRVAPQSRIVYADNDPLVLAHARALDLLAPGVVSCSRWRPDPSPLGEPPAEVDEFCGVARKPPAPPA